MLPTPTAESPGYIDRPSVCGSDLCLGVRAAALALQTCLQVLCGVRGVTCDVCVCVVRLVRCCQVVLAKVKVTGPSH